jgi:predicted RND superfamily exporter protein
VTAWLAEIAWRLRYPFSAIVVIGALAFAPSVNFTDLDNDISAWISKSDQAYKDYERFRDEFGGGRTLLVALESDHLFTPESLEFIREITADLERVEFVRRVDSLATANIVSAVEDGIEVNPLLDEVSTPETAAAARARVMDDYLLRGDLVSENGRVTVINLTFDEDHIDDVRARVIEEIHKTIDPRLPAGMRAYYNGSLEISESYNRVTIRNTTLLTPPILALTFLGVFVMFRAWKTTVLVVIAVLASAVWTMGLYTLFGFKYNVLASMIPPLIIVLAIADDVHIVQHFIHELRESGDHRQAFLSSVRHLALPLFGASATTALGLLSLATSNVLSVRTFGIGSAVGVMVDFAMSLVFLPTLLTLVPPDTAPPPQERWLVRPLQRVAHFSMRHALLVLCGLLLASAVAIGGIWKLRVDTNHINFFGESHPLHDSAEIIDTHLSGVYSFNVMLEGEPGSMKTPETMQRIEALRTRIEKLPFVKKVVSAADYVKRVNRELNGGDDAAAVLPASADAIAQELFVFELSDAGRRELQRLVSSDYSRAQVSVKLASMSSDLVFEQINEAERLARQAFAGTGITPTVTGSGRIFSTLDHYLVTSQLSSFATAFVTVFAVIFLIFRSARFGLLGVLANAVPVLAVLGLMGWMGISLNIATVMVASVALGITDDDTIHFIGRYRRDASAGMDTVTAIETATTHEGRASLTTAIINSTAFGIMLVSDYKPTAWFGGLMALTMAMAFIAEVFIVPAVITCMPSVFGTKAVARRVAA